MAEDIGGGDVLSGFGVVDTERGTSGGSTYGATDAGMTSHRGVLQPGEYVDFFELRAAVEEALGSTYAEVSAAYAVGGRLSPEKRQQREKIDARILALSRAGGSLITLANALDLSEKTIDRAIVRAKAVEVVPQSGFTGAVRSALICFKCGEPGATARKRRHSESPANEVGTINLCDAHFNPGVSKVGGRRASKRKVDVVGLITDRDTRTFGGRRIGI